LKLQDNSYISDNLKMQITDLLFKTDFNGKPGYLYLLVEHQSQPEKLMPFRILKYMIAIMEDHLGQNNTAILPVVYPMIMYSGGKPYNYSTNLLDLFEEQKELALEVFLHGYQLVDISQIPDEELKKKRKKLCLTQNN